jgi:hypothetical protein
VFADGRFDPGLLVHGSADPKAAPQVESFIAALAAHRHYAREAALLRAVERRG